ncbi:MAG: DUF58 domain-containing protein [Planctomycetota bacterium]
MQESTEIVEGLVRHLRWAVRGSDGNGASAPSAWRGSSGEFEQYRDFQPGDDVRRLDLKIYARLRRRVVRVTRQDTALPLTVLVDRTASMQGIGDGLRDAAAAQLLWLFAAVARRRGDAFRVFGYAGGTAWRWRNTSSASIDAITRELRSPSPTERVSDLQRSFATVPPHPAGRGAIIVISDAFGVENPDATIAPLLRHGPPFLLALLEPTELRPELLVNPRLGQRSLRLHSREPESPWRGTLDATTLDRYRQALASYHASLARRLRAAGGDLICIETELPLLSMATAILRSGRLLRRCRS